MVKKANSKVSTKEPISQIVFPDFTAKTDLVCQTILEDQILVIDVSGHHFLELGLTWSLLSPGIFVRRRMQGLC